MAAESWIDAFMDHELKPSQIEEIKAEYEDAVHRSANATERGTSSGWSYASMDDELTHSQIEEIKAEYEDAIHRAANATERGCTKTADNIIELLV